MSENSFAASGCSKTFTMPCTIECSFSKFLSSSSTRAKVSLLLSLVCTSISGAMAVA